MKNARAVFCLLYFCLVLPVLAPAQSTGDAIISGRVADASGAVLPGASVTLLSKGRGFELRTLTDDRGNFSFGYLAPGTYALTVAAPGFNGARLDEIRLASYEKRETPVVLQVGAPSTVISVTARPSQIDMVGPTARATLPGTAIEEMPILTGTQSRSVLPQLQLLFPGASSFRFTGMGDAYGNSLTINGSPLGGVGFYFDGIDNNYLIGDMGGSATIGPNPDAIEELSVLSQNYKAEAGGHQAQVHMRTRSGTNQLHGMVRALHLNPALSARDFFAAEKPEDYTTTGVGFNLGGPLVLPRLYEGRNRTFWFFDTEWTRSNYEQPTTNVFPSDAERSGDFSGLSPDLWPVDPATGQPFPGGRLPSNLILPQSRFYVDQFIPRDPAGGQITTPYQDRPKGYQFTTRVDHRLSGSDMLSGSLFFYRNPDTSADNSTVGTTNDNRERGYNLSIQYVRNLSGQMTNSFTFGNTYWNFDWVGNGKIQNVDLTEEGYSIHNVTSGPRGFPNVFLDTNAFYPAGMKSSKPIRTFEWKDDFSLLRRAHSWKFGADLLRTAGEAFDSSGGAPSFSFSSYNASGTANDFADFLLGIPFSYTQGGDAQVRPRRILGSLYAQDDIQLRTGLTMNLGLRYELSGALTEQDGRNGAFRPGSQSTVFPNAPAGIIFNGDFDPLLGGVMGAALMPGNRKNFAPRVGIAWSPRFQNGLAARLLGGPGHTSIRAGYGVYHILGLASPIGDVQWLPPWAVSVNRDRSILDVSGGNLSNPWGSGQDLFAGTLTQREFFPPLQWVPYVEPGLRDPYQHQWTLSIQRQLPKEVVLEIAYLGNRMLHLLRDYQANPALPTANSNTSNVESRRTYKDFGAVEGFASDGTSIYNGLQLTVARRFASRLMFNAHYVWSRTLDNAGGTGGNPFTLADRAATPWGRANSDRTHNFAGYWLLDLPGPGRIKLLKPALSGWRLSGNVQIRSGIPLNIRNPYDSTLLGGLVAGMPDITGPFQAFDPREIRTFKLPNGRTVTGNFLFDPTVIRVVNPATPAAARIGNLGRNVFSGPGTADVDLSLLKEFRVKERHRIEVRFDATNAFNHAQFVAKAATATANNAQFGRVTGTSGPRRIQFQLRYSF